MNILGLQFGHDAGAAVLTRVPVVLSTSFNGLGDPIVESPEDAIRFFIQADLESPLHRGPPGDQTPLICRRPIRWRYDPRAVPAQLTHGTDVDHAVLADPDGMGAVTPKIEPVDDDRRMRARDADGLHADDDIGAWQSSGSAAGCCTSATTLPEAV